ncbi:MAG TPA: hypothetical protein VLG92_05455 [Candidatus Saccharimonadia bacterium]|nr:hypothetical protein [Candidatus Saccharimonadia bacterium]
MNDLDSILQKQKLTPQQLLPNNFTEGVLMGIKKNKPANWTDKLAARLHTKLGIGVISGALLLSGTAAALVLWPTPSVNKTALKPLPSGNHIIGYDAKNCDYFGTAEGNQPTQMDEKVYYEVRANSKLTDTQLQTSLQGVCEENLSNDAIGVVEKSLPKGRQGDSSPAYTITGISADSIMVSLDSHYATTNFVTKPNQTYHRFDSSLVVYDESNPGSFSDLKVGDTVKMITKDTSTPPLSPTYEPANHPENQIVEAIVKIPALTADPSDFYKGVATDFVRVEPCTTSPSGFCRMYDFVKQ